jgi:putative oxidoreductase
MNASPSLTAFETFLTKLGEWSQPVLLVVIRLYWGWLFAQTGWEKLTNLSRTAGYFDSLHLPLPLVSAALAGAAECVGGVLFALGLFARFASPVLVFIMAVAYLTAQRAALTGVLHAPGAFTGAPPFLFLFATLVVFAFGPGTLSLDTWIRKKM